MKNSLALILLGLLFFCLDLWACSNPQDKQKINLPIKRDGNSFSGMSWYVNYGILPPPKATPPALWD